jgi:hypothetical protein
MENLASERIEYILYGFIVITGWYGQRGWKKLEIIADESGLKEIEKDPLQDYIGYGAQSVDYAEFDVYKKEIEETDDKIVTTEYKTPIKKIKAGKYELTPEEEEAFLQDYDIAKITYFRGKHKHLT